MTPDQINAAASALGIPPEHVAVLQEWIPQIDAWQVAQSMAQRTKGKEATNEAQ